MVAGVALQRERKSKFVKLFDKTPAGVVCPHFHELVLSNGCPYDCAYCYLRLTFRGNKSPVLFNNGWKRVERELDAAPRGVFSTGELADSLAMTPPLLDPAIDYFVGQTSKYLLLVTKSLNTAILKRRAPSQQVIVSFSVNSHAASTLYERLCPSPDERLLEASRLKDLGWRVRIRLDPIILDSITNEVGITSYMDTCRKIRAVDPELITVGTLRQYPGLHNYAREAPRKGLQKALDGRMRYPVATRVALYERLAEWLGRIPALCKETDEVWDALGWRPGRCNCTP